jgi:hypothetical protein
VIRVYDAAGNVIETREHKGDFKEWQCSTALLTVQHRLRCNFAQSKLCVAFSALESSGALLELIKTISRSPVTLDCKKLLSAQ